LSDIKVSHISYRIDFGSEFIRYTSSERALRLFTEMDDMPACLPLLSFSLSLCVCRSVYISLSLSPSMSLLVMKNTCTTPVVSYSRRTTCPELFSIIDTCRNLSFDHLPPSNVTRTAHLTSAHARTHTHTKCDHTCTDRTLYFYIK